MRVVVRAWDLGTGKGRGVDQGAGQAGMGS